jgi:hypothetical protein
VPHSWGNFERGAIVRRRRRMTMMPDVMPWRRTQVTNCRGRGGITFVVMRHSTGDHHDPSPYEQTHDSSAHPSSGHTPDKWCGSRSGSFASWRSVHCYSSNNCRSHGRCRPPADNHDREKPERGIRSVWPLQAKYSYFDQRESKRILTNQPAGYACQIFLRPGTASIRRKGWSR